MIGTKLIRIISNLRSYADQQISKLRTVHEKLSATKLKWR